MVVSGTLGMLPQNPQTLFVKKTVREDLFEIFTGSKLSRSEQEARVARMVSLCRMETLLDRHPYDLSGGEQQRAALAKVLLLQPEILLLDEPITYLDVGYQIEVLELVRELCSRLHITIVMVLHDMNFTARYSDWVYVLKQGRVFDHGRPDSILVRDTMKEVFHIDSQIIRDDKNGCPFLIPEKL